MASVRRYLARARGTDGSILRRYPIAAPAIGTSAILAGDRTRPREEPDPALGHLPSGVRVIAMAVPLPVTDVASGASIPFLLLFLMVNVAQVRLWRRAPDTPRPFRAPFVPWLQIATILIQVVLAAHHVQLNPLAWGATLGWLAIGFLANRRHDVPVRSMLRLGRGVGQSIVSAARARNANQIVIGASGEGWLEQSLFGSIPQRVGQEATVTVVMVKRHDPVRFGLRRWLGPLARRG